MQLFHKLCNFIFSTCQQQSLIIVTYLSSNINCLLYYVTLNGILIVKVKQNGLFNGSKKEIKINKLYKETDVNALIEAVHIKTNEPQCSFD